MRSDGCQECPSALLQTNQTIYTELTREWYRRVTYEMTIGMSGMEFTSRCFVPYKPLPPALPYVTPLDLFFSMQDHRRGLEKTKLHDDSGEYEWMRPRGCMDLLGELMGELSGLKRLHVTFYMSLIHLPVICKTPELLSGLMEWNMEPIRRRLRGGVDLQEEGDFYSLGGRQMV
ncbi:hypothetical protein ASPWEDRAFT_175277 [Aspergillus wentii DTO 134E9]|uniref:Uncharacterized protein n=1 Tax=Aspergillus wentii DTO 134E9 TaxID=1073089 RepID=A0A1L9RAK7_ASPWE|nr:uncharacterized protein ASPWEDRAFT_175277 [Aspergillus wentii DTO 134E9]KAI9934550.1 hypothetical protein MW887_000165 [Aspergillus wentii]OJJ31965.1 hypothetical protein ASPWEDRAFT_175277 [Aspergillus wentii DTO 134E9]